MKRKHCRNRKEWLTARASQGIGASESAAILGLSPWMTSSDLWLIKTGQREAADISDNESVSLGVKMEPILRNLFKVMHPEFRLTYHQYDLLYQAERPWIFSTLDGELYEKETKKHGILEIKTATPVGSKGWEQWTGQIPAHYLCQIEHQLLCTGYDFAILFACLFTKDEDFSVRAYRFEREDLQEDMDLLLKKETEFWDSVQNRKLPGLTIMF